MSGHIVPVKNYVAVFVALLVLTALTTESCRILTWANCDRQDSRDRLEHRGGADDRGGQDAAGGFIFHACEIQPRH